VSYFLYTFYNFVEMRWVAAVISSDDQITPQFPGSSTPDTYVSCLTRDPLCNTDQACIFHLIPDPGRNMVVWIIRGFYFLLFCSLDMRICVALGLLFRHFGLVFSFFLSAACLFRTKLISSSDYISLAERVPRKDPPLDDISKSENRACSISFQWQYKIQLKRFYLKLNV
jgi:hypothetical protein